MAKANRSGKKSEKKAASKEKPAESIEGSKQWFMKNIILPNNEIIDKPGYIVSKYAGKGTRCFVREVLFPERILSDIETKAAAKLGDAGLKAIYSAGKNWGIRYGITTGLPKKSDMSEKDMRDFLGSFMQFMESEYAKKASFDLEYDKDRFITRYDELLVCRLSGKGHFMLGTMNGAWQHICGKETEGIHRACQGKGDKECIIECAPIRNLREQKKAFSVKALPGIGLEKEYFSLNTVKKAQYAKNSLLDLLTGKVVSYEGGAFVSNGERFLLNEASSIYFLEMMLGKTKQGEQILFDAAFDFCNRLAKTNASSKMAQDFLPALGFGDTTLDISGGKAFCRSYPWTGYWNKTTFPILRGMLSGIACANSKKGVRFIKADAVISSGSLDIVLRS